MKKSFNTIFFILCIVAGIGLSVVACECESQKAASVNKTLIHTGVNGDKIYITRKYKDGYTYCVSWIEGPDGFIKSVAVTH